jgi:type II secretory pathway component PulF
MEDCLVCFSFLLFVAPTFNTGLKQVNQNLLAVFTLIIFGSFDLFTALLFYVCLYANSV